MQGRIITKDIIDEEIEKINNKRYTALFNRLQQACEGEILKYQLANDYEKLMIFFERMKILDEIERDITFSNGEIDQIINRAKTIRNRYTILTIVWRVLYLDIIIKL